MIPGETILSGAPVAPGVSKFKVMKSAAGFYIGTTQTMSAGEVYSYSRESGYFHSQEAAQEALDTYNKTGDLPNAR